MAEPRKKTLSYHRAEYLAEHRATVNFGMCIKLATDKCRTAAERTVSRGGGQVIRLAHMKLDDGKGIFLHLTVDTPGEFASVVPKVADDAKEIKVSTIPPPNDAEFMDGDAFIYVRRNDVCLCTTGIRAGAVRYFFQRFFEDSQIRKDAGAFVFMNALDTQKIAVLQRKGVKEIELKATLYSASMDYHKRRQQAVGALDAVSRHFKAIFASEHDVSDDALRVAVVLTMDKRRKNGIVLGRKRLEKISIDVIENQENVDEYTIITNDNEKIRPSEIVLHATADLDSMGKSVERDQTWDALLDYYKGLADRGQLEQ